MTNGTYSGDVTLHSERDTPVKLVDPEDVFVRSDSVAEHLRLQDVEYVFTAQPVESRADVPTPSKRYHGDIEDGYLDRDGVYGSAIVASAEDVFVAPGAVAGRIDADGAEQVFHDGQTPQRLPRADDASIVGWQRSRSITDPPGGIALAGIGHDVTVTDPPDRLTLYLTGHDHEVRIEGGPSHLTVHVVGRDNTVSVGPYVEATIETESGFENDIERDPVPVADVIETSKKDAFGEVTFGRARVTYQTPAPDEQWCPNCGTEADAVVERHQRDALFLFGICLYTFDDGGLSYNCESCSTLSDDTQLSAGERRTLLR